MDLCNKAEGWYAGARNRILTIHATNHYQPQIVPRFTQNYHYDHHIIIMIVSRFHPVGFQKAKIPAAIYARILNNRKKLINEGRKFQIEPCDFGMQNCQQIVESRSGKYLKHSRKTCNL